MKDVCPAGSVTVATRVSAVVNVVSVLMYILTVAPDPKTPPFKTTVVATPLENLVGFIVILPEAASVTGMLMNGATSGIMNNTTTSREANLLEFNPLTQPHHAIGLAVGRGYLRVTPHHPKNPDPQTPRGPSRDSRS
jgi:hypothetical protein